MVKKDETVPTDWTRSDIGPWKLKENSVLNLLFHANGRKETK